MCSEIELQKYGDNIIYFPRGFWEMEGNAINNVSEPWFPSCPGVGGLFVTFLLQNAHPSFHYDSRIISELASFPLPAMTTHSPDTTQASKLRHSDKVNICTILHTCGFELWTDTSSSPVIFWPPCRNSLYILILIQIWGWLDVFKSKF